MSESESRRILIERQAVEELPRLVPVERIVVEPSVVVVQVTTDAEC